jgi:HTH-type transcriptional regulator/antitoxin HigA
MRTKSRRRAAVAGDDYLELVRRFPLRPIRTRDECDVAMKVLDELLVRSGLSPGESDYVQVLAQTIHAYDQRHSSLQREKMTPIEALRFLMEENRMNTVALGKLVGGSGQASMILTGKRELSKANIRTLAERFKVSPAMFF